VVCPKQERSMAPARETMSLAICSPQTRRGGIAATIAHTNAQPADRPPSSSKTIRGAFSYNGHQFGFMADLRCTEKSKAAKRRPCLHPPTSHMGPVGLSDQLVPKRFSLGRLEKDTLARKAFLRPPTHNARSPLPAALVRRGHWRGFQSL